MKKLQDWEIELIVSTVALVCETFPDLGRHDRDRVAADIYDAMQRKLKTFYDDRERR
jgi:hypothetical protein